MSLKIKFLSVLAGLLASLFMVTATQAAMPEPVDPRVIVDMSFDQRLAHLKQVNDSILKSTHQEIRAYWEKFGQKISALSPADQKYIYEKRQANAKALTQEQKNAITAQRKAYFSAMTPEQKKAVKAYIDGSKQYQANSKQ